MGMYQGGYMKALPADERAEVRSIGFCRRKFLKIYNYLKEKHSIYINSKEVIETARAYYLTKFSEGENPRDCHVRKFVQENLSKKNPTKGGRTTTYATVTTWDSKTPKRGGKY